MSGSNPWLCVLSQGVVISPRHRSHSCDRGQEAVKGSRAVFGVGQAVIFKLSNSGQDVRVHIAHSVVKCVQSNSQGPLCGAVKSNKNNSPNFLTLVAAVTTAPMGVTTPCTSSSEHTLQVSGWGL